MVVRCIRMCVSRWMCSCTWKVWLKAQVIEKCKDDPTNEKNGFFGLCRRCSVCWVEGLCVYVSERSNKKAKIGFYLNGCLFKLGLFNEYLLWPLKNGAIQSITQSISRNVIIFLSFKWTRLLYLDVSNSFYTLPSSLSFPLFFINKSRNLFTNSVK